MRIAHVVPISSTDNEGILSSVRALSLAERGHGCDAMMWVVSGAKGARWGEDERFPSWRTLARAIAARKPDMVHLHGLWTLSGLAAAAACRAHHIPYVVSPRGMLLPDAFRRKRWKKWPYWWLVERWVVGGAALCHATSEEERRCIETRVATPVAVVPNGAPACPEGLSRDEGVAGDARPYVLYLGRIHPIKNLESLLRARLPQGMRLRLVIAGDGSAVYVEQLTALARRSECLDVEFVGRVSGTKKWSLIAGAAALVLPSYSENFANVVVEALAAGTPVIASRGTPWRVLDEADAGMWIDATPDDLGEALASVVNEPRRWERRRENASRLRTRYSWATLAAEMVEAYRAARGRVA